MEIISSHFGKEKGSTKSEGKLHHSLPGSPKKSAWRRVKNF